MRHFSAWVIFWLALGAALTGRAQGGAAYGDWQLHLPARHPLMLAEAGNRLYVADESSFYYYDKSLSTTRLLSRRDGLSDVGVAALAYDSASAQLVIAYRNGNLDLLGTGGTVRNITDLLRKQTQSAKSIYQIQIFNGLAYVNTSLGVVVLDLARREVRDTYSAIGPGGAAVVAYATAVVHDTIFAATSVGVLRGRLSAAVNLLDYRSWTLETVNPQALGPAVQQLAVYRGHVVASSAPGGGSYLAYLAGMGAARAWRLAGNVSGTLATRLRVSAGQLLVTFDNAPLRRFDPATARLVDALPAASTGNRVPDAVRETDGTLYVASYDLGLLRFGPGTTANPEVIRPNAPEATLAYGLVADAASNTVDVFSGGYSGDSGLQFGYRGGFYEYSGGQWTNYTATNYPASAYPNLLDVSHGTRLPNGTLYIASYGNGLLEWKGPGQFRQLTYGTPGVPLRSALDPDLTYIDYVRVTDVAADPGGRYLWVSNRHGRSQVPGLFRYQFGANKWTAAPAYADFSNLDRLVVDGYGNPWATESRKGGNGLVAYDTTSHQAFYLTVATTANGTPNVGLPSNSLYALARDRNGAIWMGTGQGVAYVSDPSVIIGGAAQPFVSQPVVRQGSGSGYAALYNETVTCIAVDGANRKWFGTRNGLWLFSANADEALLHFTTTNSPLPSNTISGVAVNDKTGEVFVATDAGVVSYQGSASVTESQPSCAEVYPNPVRPEFAGTVGIRGVVNNAQVKITDVAGHLVYSTTAAGGTVTWNLTDAQGRRVRSGVYLVLSSDAQGNNTCVSKVAVLSN